MVRYVSNLELAPTETRCGGSIASGAAHQVLVGRDVPITKTSMVNRTLPHRDRRMIGAWCFVDHFGPDAVITMPGMRVPPHPHIGLQTVTWLIDGVIEHRDSLGSVQSIEPGQLNLMTAGRGISHSEESPRQRPPFLHGVQLWVALPGAERSIPPRFEHLADLPRLEDGGVTTTVLLGQVAGHRSPALVHSLIMGAEIAMGPGTSTRLPLDPTFEHGALVVEGEVVVDGEVLVPGALLYLGSGRGDLSLECPGGGRMMILGGEPFAEEIIMWWNFVGRTHEEIVQARADWMSPERFGSAAPPVLQDRYGVVSGFDGGPLPAPELPNLRLRPRARS
jgi:redox-sensitive bicupin YhaK (pirin superfamily)